MTSGLVMERFRLLERIGSGGMGVVYRAFDERLQREVAVKEIVASDPERVLREAQAAARLNHPGIVTVYELGRRGGRALLVSELVPGATLAELRAANSLSDRDVAELGADLCDALSHAHAHGVVHRDVKPQNVIVRDDNEAGRRAKLMDFGIARLAGATSLTASGEIVGTLAYMSPEQAEGLAAGPPADVYSLALTLYECWAGLNPVVGDNPAATARRIGGPVTSLAEIRPDLPASLAAVVDASLLCDASARPTPQDLREHLNDAIPLLDSVRPVPVPVGTQVAERPASRRALVPLIALAGLGACLLLLAGPGSAPGAALVLAVLAAPAILALPGIRPAIPLAGVALGAVGTAIAYPALAALAGDRAPQRALAGALGWCWALAAASGLGAGSGLGIVTRAPDGWESSVAVAASTVLAPLLEPAALLGAGAFAVAAATLGWILAARHISLAALGALVWAAGLVTLGGIVADGSLGELPLVVALAAAAALAFEHGRRMRERRWGSADRPAAGLKVDRSTPGSPPAHAGIRAVS
jgi:eukaryotic-like serine/threonine-protein kinase